MQSLCPKCNKIGNRHIYEKGKGSGDYHLTFRHYVNGKLAATHYINPLRKRIITI